jgi:hypothetical protein
MRTYFFAPAACALLAGCGYVGEPLPPALNIATPIADLRAIEYGDHILIDFTIPAMTTEGLPLPRIERVDLRIGATVTPFDINRWSAGAQEIPVQRNEPGAAQAQTSASAWIGKDVAIGVRIVNRKGRASEWSNLASVHVVAPVPKPLAVKAAPDPQGVQLSWSSPAAHFRIYRRAPDQQAPSLLGTSDQAAYLDKTAEYGKVYEYLVQAVENGAESEVSSATSIPFRDIFPPQAPAGLNGIAGIGAIELVWERNTEPDLRGYRVYRAPEGGQFAVAAEFAEGPAYSDRQIEAGKKYRYAVTALDQSGNESAKSNVVEVTAP